MKILRTLVDNSTTLLAWLTSLLGLLVLFHVNISKDQLGGIVAFAGATIGVLSVVLTTAKRSVVSRVTNAGAVVAGQAAVVDTGSQALLTETKGGDPVPLVAVKSELVNSRVTIPNQEAA